MSNPAFPVEAKVRLVEAGSLSHGIDEHTVVLGDSIKINTSLIERYFCSSATLLAQDLMTVVGAVKYAGSSNVIMQKHGVVRSTLRFQSGTSRCGQVQVFSQLCRIASTS